MVILTIIDRFSRMAHIVTLKKLPIAKERAQLLVQHILWLHRLLVDVVSDQGPQFAFSYLSEFCGLMGTAPSLSSGFHPVQQPHKKDEPGPGGHLTPHGLQGSVLLVVFASVGGVHPQRALKFCNRDVSVQVCLWLSTTFVTNT